MTLYHHLLLQNLGLKFCCYGNSYQVLIGSSAYNSLSGCGSDILQVTSLHAVTVRENELSLGNFDSVTGSYMYSRYAFIW